MSKGASKRRVMARKYHALQKKVFREVKVFMSTLFRSNKYSSDQIEDMGRRQFTKLMGLGMAALMTTSALGGTAFTEKTGLPAFDMQKAMNSSDRVLVLLRLNGGNDGLNTLIPLNMYDNLMIQRPDILIPQGDILSLSGQNIGFHPSMSGMQGLFNNGKLGIVQNVGVFQGSRSHFTNTDNWSTGITEQAHPQKDTGWLGRMLGTEFPGFPNNFPNVDYPDPFAISISTSTSHTCQDEHANFSHPTIINSNLLTSISGGTLELDGTYNSGLLEHIKNIGEQTNQYNARIQSAIDAGTSLSSQYGTDSLSQALRNVAKMITGGLQAKIYVVDIGGFDTHGNQVIDGAVTTGRHADLWNRISTAVSAFMHDLSLVIASDGNSYAKKVIGMTFSEFGRQTAQNGSLGTDHGEAAPMFFFGECIGSDVIGSNPIISTTIQNGAAIPVQIDYRHVYASILRDWFGFSEMEIEANFPGAPEITYYNIVDPCAVALSIPEEQIKKNGIRVYPNPCVQSTLHVQTDYVKGPVVFDVYTSSGRHVSRDEGNIPFDAQHEISVDVSRLTSGTYVVHVQNGATTKKVKFQKM